MRISYLILFIFSPYLFLFGCSDVENKDSPLSITIGDNRLQSTNDKFEVADDWIYLSDKDIAKLLKVNVPADWIHTKDPVLFDKYFHAQLFQKHGDIQQVRIIIEFKRNTANGYTSNNLYKHILYYEASHYLSPGPVTRRTLEETRSEQMIISLDVRNRRIIDEPELTAGLIRQDLLKKFGDISQVHIYIETLLKFLLNESVTDAEYLSYLEAKFHLWPNDKNQFELGLFPDWLRDE